MTFDAPLPFDEAIKQMADKKILPTELSTREMQENTSAELREHSFFSARVINAHVLQEFRDSAMKIVKGGTNEATMRRDLKDLLDSIGYQAEEGKEGTIEDLGSNSRLGLILRTNVSMVRNFGQWQQGNRPGALEAFPAQELIRVADRMRPRDWIDRWDEAADELGDGTTATDAGETGRMVALKNDAIWTSISAFDLPYPPFDFNSGMGVEDVDYEEAVELGVMEAEDDPIRPQPRGMNDGLASSVGDLDDDFARVLAEGMGEAVHLVAGVLRLKNDAGDFRNRAGRVLTLMNEALGQRDITRLRDTGQAVLRGLEMALEGACT